MFYTASFELNKHLIANVYTSVFIYYSVKFNLSRTAYVKVHEPMKNNGTRSMKLRIDV